MITICFQSDMKKTPTGVIQVLNNGGDDLADLPGAGDGLLGDGPHLVGGGGRSGECSEVAC